MAGQLFLKSLRFKSRKQNHPTNRNKSNSKLKLCLNHGSWLWWERKYCIVLYVLYRQNYESNLKWQPRLKLNLSSKATSLSWNITNISEPIKSQHKVLLNKLVDQVRAGSLISWSLVSSQQMSFVVEAVRCGNRGEEGADAYCKLAKNGVSQKKENNASPNNVWFIEYDGCWWLLVDSVSGGNWHSH